MWTGDEPGNTGIACQSQKAAAPAFESAVHQTANPNSAHPGVSRAIGEESGRGQAWAPSLKRYLTEHDRSLGSGADEAGGSLSRLTLRPANRSGPTHHRDPARDRPCARSRPPPEDRQRSALRRSGPPGRSPSHRDVSAGEQPGPRGLPRVIARDRDRRETPRAGADHVRRPLDQHNPRGRLSGGGDQPQPGTARREHLWRMVMRRRVAQHAAQPAIPGRCAGRRPAGATRRRPAWREVLDDASGRDRAARAMRFAYADSPYPGKYA
jgi:hypothetical protein